MCSLVALNLSSKIFHNKTIPLKLMQLQISLNLPNVFKAIFMPLKNQKCKHQKLPRVKHKTAQTAIIQYLWKKNTIKTKPPKPSNTEFSPIYMNSYSHSD